jgi:hypothetical protein
MGLHTTLLLGSPKGRAETAKKNYACVEGQYNNWCDVWRAELGRVDFIPLDRHTDRRLALVNTVMNVLVSQTSGDFMTS